MYILLRQDNQDERGTKKSIKAIERGEKMEEDSILALSFYLETALSPSASASTSDEPDEDGNSLLYISGIVEAEMRNNTYIMKLVIDGETGEPLQSTCDCPAGAGPTGTCKHIVGVLLAIVKFADDGILEVKQSCTEQLQTFKKPKKSHQGSPVRAEDLGRGFQIHDPRPIKYQKWSKENAADHVYNATINFCAESGLDISMRYAMPCSGERNRKPDLHAAENDHDYLQDPLAQC